MEKGKRGKREKKEKKTDFKTAEKLGILVIAQDWLRGETLGLANQLSPVMSHLIVRIARGRYDGVSAGSFFFSFFFIFAVGVHTIFFSFIFSFLQFFLLFL